MGGRWTLRGRLTLVFAVLTGLLVIDSVSAVRAFSQRRDADRQEEELSGLSFAAAGVGQAYVEQEAAARGFVITGQERFLEPLADNRERADELVALLHERLDDERSIRTLDEVVAAFQQWRTDAGDRQVELRQAGQVAEANALVSSGVGGQLFDVVRGKLAELADAIAGAIARERGVSRDAQDRVTAIVVVSSVIAALLAALALVILRWGLTKPLDVLLDRIGAVSGGDLTAEVPATGPDELATLGAAVDTMRRQMLADASRRAESALIAGQEDERRRIAGALHDDQVQALAASSLFMQRARRRITDPDAVALVEQAEQSVRDSTQRLRSMMFELHSPVLESEGLLSALEVYLYETAGSVAWKVNGGVDPATPAVLEALGYRLAKEALSNCIRHADARQITVTIESDRTALQITVADDGKGFHVDDALLTAPGHLGIGHAKSLAHAVGGQLDVASAIGQGSSVMFRLPISA